MSPNEHSIRLALYDAKRPLTVAEIAVRTGISTASVYRICDDSEAIQNIGGRPYKFYAERHAEMDANNLLVRYQKPAEGWLAWSEDIKYRIPELLNIDDRSASQRATIAEALQGIGVLFLSLSRDLADGVNRPDWRKRLDK